MENKVLPENDKIVLLCCVGRSGSTTLQRILNTIPNSNICGENYGAVFDILRFYRNIKRTTFDQVVGGKKPVSYDFLIEKNVKPAWYNSYNYDEVVNMIKFLIMRLFKKNGETTLWGFKEIRWDHTNMDLINEFKELFPQAKVVFLIRQNIVKQSRSGWFKNDGDAINIINKQNKVLINYHNAHKEFTHFMTFERMFNKAHVIDMFNFIGCGEHFHENNIIDVLKNSFEN